MLQNTIIKVIAGGSLEYGKNKLFVRKHLFFFKVHSKYTNFKCLYKHFFFKSYTENLYKFSMYDLKKNGLQFEGIVLRT